VLLLVGQLVQPLDVLDRHPEVDPRPDLAVVIAPAGRAGLLRVPRQDAQLAQHRHASLDLARADGLALVPLLDARRVARRADRLEGRLSVVAAGVGGADRADQDVG
jgi:hypothetical protein